MYGHYNVKCIVNGNPSLFTITPTTNLQLFVDMSDEYDVTFAYGSISIPIERAQSYKQYQNLPKLELERYLHTLLGRVLDEHAKKDTQMLDICSIQYEVLSEHWQNWLSAGYVRRNDPRPAILSIYAPRKKSSWF